MGAAGQVREFGEIWTSTSSCQRACERELVKKPAKAAALVGLARLQVTMAAVGRELHAN